MNTEDLPLLTTVDDWLDLKIGDRAIAKGKLYGPLCQGDDDLILTLADRESIVVDVLSPDANPTIPQGIPLTITVTRTQDGVTITPQDIQLG